jgi:hypothetical protein
MEDTCSVQSIGSKTGSGVYLLMLCSFGRTDFCGIRVSLSALLDKVTDSKRLGDGIASGRPMQKVDRVR